MKILFLDIDGVLNTGDDTASRHYMKKRTNNRDWTHDEQNCNLFDERCVRWLHYIIEETGAKIVISSTWRRKGLQYMWDFWKRRDLPGEVIGITPVLNRPRGEEIDAWLEENDYWTNYCIVDDDSDMLFEQKFRFVKTHNRFGLTLETAEAIVNILNKID